METNLNETAYPHATIKDSLEQGRIYQDFVCIELAKAQKLNLQNMTSRKYQNEVGENLQGVEIKLDNRCLETKQLSIEIAEKSNRDYQNWIPSGIMRDDNSFLYIQGNFKTFWLFSKRDLKLIHSKNRFEIRDFNGTLQSYFLPLKMADHFALYKWSKPTS